MGKIVKCIYPTDKDATAGIEIDAFFSEKYSFGNKITDKPSEGDATSSALTVTDEGDELSIEAFIGATKFEVVASAPPKEAKVSGEYPRDRVLSAFEELKRLKESKQPMDIVTGLTTMSGMVITSLEIERDENTGADLSFSATFHKAPVSSSGSAATPATENAVGVASTGKSGTEEPPRSNFMTEQADEWEKNGLISSEMREKLKKTKGY